MGQTEAIHIALETGDDLGPGHEAIGVFSPKCGVR
jgi:hypothetical protein